MQSFHSGDSWKIEQFAPYTGRCPPSLGVKMRIIRLAISPATSDRFLLSPGSPAKLTLKSSPQHEPSVLSDSMMRKVVGNQMGPRQFELPPLILFSDSPGS